MIDDSKVNLEQHYAAKWFLEATFIKAVRNIAMYNCDVGRCDRAKDFIVATLLDGCPCKLRFK